MKFKETENSIYFSINPYHYTSKGLNSFDNRLRSVFAQIGLTVVSIKAERIHTERCYEIITIESVTDLDKLSECISNFLSSMRKYRR